VKRQLRASVFFSSHSVFSDAFPSSSFVKSAIFIRKVRLENSRSRKIKNPTFSRVPRERGTLFGYKWKNIKKSARGNAQSNILFFDWPTAKLSFPIYNDNFWSCPSAVIQRYYVMNQVLFVLYYITYRMRERDNFKKINFLFYNIGLYDFYINIIYGNKVQQHI